MTRVDLTGDWNEAKKIFATLGDDFLSAADKAVLAEAHYLRSKIIQGFTAGAPAGKPWVPLSPLTLAIRKAQGFGGTKILIRSGTLRNSVTATKVGNAYFVGVLRKAKGKDKQSMINIAKLHEYGSKPIRITAKMRRFLFAMMKKAGMEIGAGGGGGGSSGAPRGYIKIPPRPFLGPIFDKYAVPEEVKKRFWTRVAKALNYKLGKP